MRVLKFNESIKSENLIDDIYVVKTRLNRARDNYNIKLKEITPLLTEYIMMINPKLVDGYNEHWWVDMDNRDALVEDIAYLNNGNLEVSFWDQTPYDEDELSYAQLYPADIEDFKKFAKDPKLYRDTKKYNL